MFFLTGGVGLENKLANPDPKWLSDKSWDEICRMNDLQNFKGFRKDFQDNITDWRLYYDDRAPHEAELPGAWHTKLNEFQRLIVLRCIRPDKVSGGREQDSVLLGRVCDGEIHAYWCIVGWVAASHYMYDVQGCCAE